MPAATPDRVSEHGKVTVTGTLFQPQAFAAGNLLSLIRGGALSSFIARLCGASLLPACKVADCARTLRGNEERCRISGNDGFRTIDAVADLLDAGTSGIVGRSQRYGNIAIVPTGAVCRRRRRYVCCWRSRVRRRALLKQSER